MAFLMCDLKYLHNYLNALYRHYSVDSLTQVSHHRVGSTRSIESCKWNSSEMWSHKYFFDDFFFARRLFRQCFTSFFTSIYNLYSFSLSILVLSLREIVLLCAAFVSYSVIRLAYLHRKSTEKRFSCCNRMCILSSFWYHFPFVVVPHFMQI